MNEWKGKHSKANYAIAFELRLCIIAFVGRLHVMKVLIEGDFISVSLLAL